MKKFSKGFTLIELLVVIAIIGILSSVVLASLNTARGKGANAAIKANLANMRAQAEIVYDTAGNYTGLCANAVIANATAAAAAANSSSVVVDNTLTNPGLSTKVSCHEGTTVWAVSAPLKVAEGSNNYWCADSTGASKGHAAVLAASATVCP